VKCSCCCAEAEAEKRKKKQQKKKKSTFFMDCRPVGPNEAKNPAGRTCRRQKKIQRHETPQKKVEMDMATTMTKHSG
jgi:hypothetical protein